MARGKLMSPDEKLNIIKTFYQFRYDGLPRSKAITATAKKVGRFHTGVRRLIAKQDLFVKELLDIHLYICYIYISNQQKRTDKGR